LDHWLFGVLISSWLVISQQLFRICFRWRVSCHFLTV